MHGKKKTIEGEELHQPENPMDEAFINQGRQKGGVRQEGEVRLPGSGGVIGKH